MLLAVMWSILLYCYYKDITRLQVHTYAYCTCGACLCMCTCALVYTWMCFCAYMCMCAHCPYALMYVLCSQFFIAVVALLTALEAACFLAEHAIVNKEGASGAPCECEVDRRW